MSKVQRFRRMPLRVYATRKVLHFFIGHLPVFQRNQKIDGKKSQKEKVYKCYWCQAELKRGMWEFLYDEQGRAQP